MASFKASPQLGSTRVSVPPGRHRAAEKLLRAAGEEARLLAGQPAAGPLAPGVP